jgi:hypothetical protein
LSFGPFCLRKIKFVPIVIAAPILDGATEFVQLHLDILKRIRDFQYALFRVLSELVLIFSLRPESDLDGCRSLLEFPSGSSS